MIAITCEKCRRRFTPTPEEIQGLLAANQGKKYVLVLCPHCGKGNKVSAQRLGQALRLSPVAGAAPTPPASESPAPADEEANPTG